MIPSDDCCICLEKLYILDEVCGGRGGRGGKKNANNAPVLMSGFRHLFHETYIS